jgi:hypothetical protein
VGLGLVSGPKVKNQTNLQAIVCPSSAGYVKLSKDFVSYFDLVNADKSVQVKSVQAESLQVVNRGHWL